MSCESEEQRVKSKSQIKKCIQKESVFKWADTADRSGKMKTELTIGGH